ncbi:putative neuraminidase [Prauserella shujinwangii]|uniref:Putative neuraminidase n=1 Tax=Prauserella shujinwangii TaxID=1453103 RepID=A0A2T0LTK3_9PSEU|nr:exo-alpha-sialidase [Prauserella shujinwangii]PRX47033.1 putative neuraminidase [Prauserella shujinwangii]
MNSLPSTPAAPSHDVLPATTVQCHAANLVLLPDGALGCAWFGGTQEGLSDIAIWFSRRAPDGSWTPPVQVSDDPARSEQNPVPFVAESGELRLFYTAQSAGRQDTAEVRLAVSHDGGRSWEPGRTEVPARPGVGVFIRQPPVALDDGSLVLPAFFCPQPDSGRWVGDDDYSGVLVSSDGGSTWTARDVPGSTGCVHMNVLRLPGGSFLALFRRRQADAVHRSHSPDGVTWSAPAPTELPNNNSSIQAIVLHDGRVVVAYNHSSAADAVERRSSLYDEIEDPGLSDEDTAARPGLAFWGAPRAPLTLAVSSDGGRTWPVRRNVEEGDGYCLTNNSREGLNRELSYPSLVQTPDGLLHLAYTRFRQAIAYVRLHPSWLDA